MIKPKLSAQTEVPPTEHEIREVAARVVSRYLRNWGQSVKERSDAMQEAADLAKVEVKFLEKDGHFVPKYPKGGNWPAFRAAIEGCRPKGQFEWVQDAVVEVIKQFRGGDV